MKKQINEKWQCTHCGKVSEIQGSSTAMNMFYMHIHCPHCNARGQWVKLPDEKTDDNGR